MLPALISAFGAAFLYGAATILQAVGVRRAAAHEGSGWLDRLWAGRLYAAGLVLDTLGFLASIAALRHLPLFVVESAIASSVAVTAVLAVLFLGVRLSGKELGALGAVGAGLVGLALSAQEGAAVPLSGPASWWLLGLALPVALAGVIAVRRPASASIVLLAVTAGLGFGATGIAARVLVVPTPWWQAAGDPVFWALVVYAAVAMIAYGTALQRGAVTLTAAVTFAVETIVPAAIGLLWLGDRVRPGFGVVAVLGFALTLIGCMLLARHSSEDVGSPA